MTTRAATSLSPILASFVLANLTIPVMAATPLNDLGTGLYLGQYQGGLYPQGSNEPPPAHAAAGLARAAGIGPLDTQGQPDPNGKFVFLSIGMSNTTQEFSGGSPNSLQGTSYSFMGQAAAHPAVNHQTMVLFDGARGGQDASTWDQPTSTNYTRIATDLTAAGLSEQQVRVAWVKVANASPTSSLPNANADAYHLEAQTGNILRAMKQHYPNLDTVFVASRIYAGYATSTLNPEPYAYESGLAMKWLIEAQINQAGTGTIDARAGNLAYSGAGAGAVAPWTAWGPYLWADGPNARSDGLTWVPSDFASDGTHPSNPQGREKVAHMLMRFMLTSPFAQPWFLNTVSGDASLDKKVDLTDFTFLASNFNGTGKTWQQGDFNDDGKVDLTDFAFLAKNFNQVKSADASAATVVPEPLAAGTIPAGLLLARRRRRNKRSWE